MVDDDKVHAPAEASAARPDAMARRRSPRVRTQAHVIFSRGSRRAEGRALNIGLGGLAVATAPGMTPAVGDEAVVVLRLPGMQPLPFSGVVRWSTETAFGLRYGPLGSLQTRIIVELLSRGNAFR